MTYIEPRFGRVGVRGSATGRRRRRVCATPGVSRASVSIRAMTALGALDRGGIGQLHVEEQIALVLLRDEAGRRVR